MKIIKYEFYKLFSEKTYCILVILLLILNVTLFYQNSIQETDGHTPANIKSVYDDLAHLSDPEKLDTIKEWGNEIQVMVALSGAEEFQQAGDYSVAEQLLEDYKEKIPLYIEKFQKGDFLKYTSDPFAERELLQTVFQEVDAVMHYEQYLQQITDNANVMGGSSLFSQPDTFAYRNIQKTPEAFSHLTGLQLSVDISNGVNLATQSAVTDILAVLFILLTSMALIFPEREKGLIHLTKPNAHGYHNTILKKIIVIFLMCVGAILVFYGSNLFMSMNLYGLGDISRPIQSVWGFIGSPFRITVLQFFIFYYITKTAMLFLIAMAVSLICMKANKAVMIYIGSVILFSVSFALFLTIDAQSIWSFFKYINLIPLTQVSVLFQQYTNLNILNYPVNIWPVAVFLYIITVTLCIFFIIKSYCRPQIAKTNKIYNFFIRFRSRFRKEHLSTSVLGNEIYKNLVTNKIGIFLILVLCFQFYSYYQIKSYDSLDELYYRQYMSSLQGEMTEEKEEIIQQENQRFQDAMAALSSLGEDYSAGKINSEEYTAASFPYQNILMRQNAFQKVIQQHQYIVEQRQAGNNPYFIYETGFSKLFGEEKGTDFLNGIKLCLILIIGLCMLYVSDYTEGAMRIVHAAKNGRKELFWSKFIIGFLLTIPIFIAVYFPDIYFILKNYGITGIHFPANSLQFLESIPANYTVLQYFISIYIVRFLGAFMIMVFIYLVSIASRNLLFTMLFPTVILLAPMVLPQFGFTFFENVPVSSLLYANEMVQETKVLLLTIPLSIIFIFFTIYISHKLYSKREV